MLEVTRRSLHARRLVEMTGRVSRDDYKGEFSRDDYEVMNNLDALRASFHRGKYLSINAWNRSLWLGSNR